jgi:hypothetical protein
MSRKTAVLPAWKVWRLRDIERLAIQQWVADKFRQDSGWQVVRNAWVLLSGILETAFEFGDLQTNPARGMKFPQKGLKRDRRSSPATAWQSCSSGLTNRIALW